MDRTITPTAPVAAPEERSDEPYAELAIEAAAPETRSPERGAALTASILVAAAAMTVAWVYSLAMLVRWLIAAML